MLQLYDKLLEEIKYTLQENVYVEDNKVYIKNKLKYDIFNMIEKEDFKFIENLLNEKGFEE
jgi:hypothetical protein